MLLLAVQFGCVDWGNDEACPQQYVALADVRGGVVHECCIQLGCPVSMIVVFGALTVFLVLSLWVIFDIRAETLDNLESSSMSLNIYHSSHRDGGDMDMYRSVSDIISRA